MSGGNVSSPTVELLLLTGRGAVDTAVAGMTLGIIDYLNKLADVTELLAKLAAARQRKWEQEERQCLAEARMLVRRSGNM